MCNLGFYDRDGISYERTHIEETKLSVLRVIHSKDELMKHDKVDNGKEPTVQTTRR